MKHLSSQILFRHWDEQRNQRSLPERSDIDPARIRRALADTVIMSYDTASNHRFRLAGTRICALFGQELKEASFVSLWRKADRTAIAHLISTMVDDSIGMVAAVTGRSHDQADIDLELLLLPLRHGGHTHLRLIGSIAPLAPPAWLGASPLTELSLGDYRYLGHNLTMPSIQPRLDAGQPPDRVRYGLAVYDGGRT